MVFGGGWRWLAVVRVLFGGYRAVKGRKVYLE